MKLIGIIIAAVIIAFILLFIFLPAVAWSILAFLVLVLLLILFVPVGAELSYISGELSLSAKLGFYLYKIFPKKEKPEPPDKENKEKKSTSKKKNKANEEAKGESFLKKLSLNFEEIIEILKKALDSLGKFGKLTIHKFTLHFLAAGKDPYSTAMTYNYVNAALSALAPCADKAFRIKGDVDVWTDIDFTSEKMDVELDLSITLRLIQFLHVAVVAGIGIAVVLIKNRIRLSKERRTKAKLVNGPEQPIKTVDNKTNIKTEERMDSNG